MRFMPAAKIHPSIIRLPLTAFIDVVLFILIYFLIAGSLAPEEAELASGLRVEKKALSATGAADSASVADLSPQVVSVEPGPSGKPVYRMGSRVLTSRRELEVLLRELPKQQGVIIKVPGTVTVDAAAAALQAAHDSGFTRISYVPAA